jgi:hypothetical protein
MKSSLRGAKRRGNLIRLLHFVRNDHFLWQLIKAAHYRFHRETPSPPGGRGLGGGTEKKNPRFQTLITPTLTSPIKGEEKNFGFRMKPNEKENKNGHFHS